MAGFDQNVVQAFLDENPDFVRKWFINNVDVVTMQEWMDEDDDEEQIEGDQVGTLKSNYSIGMQRNSLTSNMFRDFLQGKRKQTSQSRRMSQLRDMSDMDIFMELIRDVANELDVDILCHKILINVSILTKSDKGSLFLMRGSREKKYLVSKLFNVTENATLEDCLHTDDNQIRIPLGKGIAGTVALSKEAINIKDAYEDSRFNKEIDIKTGYRTRNILCMPILNYEGDVIGVAQIINKNDPDCNVFTAKDEEVFRNYLTFCGIGLTNAQLFEMSVEEFKRNQLLLNLAKGIFAEQQNLDKLVEKIMLEAQELLQCQRCNVYLMEDSIEGHNFMHKKIYQDAQKEVLGKIKEGKEALLKHHDAINDLKKCVKKEAVQPEDIAFTKIFQLKVGSDGAKGTVKNLAISDVADCKTIGIARQVASSLEVFNVSDTVSDPEFSGSMTSLNFVDISELEIEDYDGFKIKGVLSIPIINENKDCVGVVQLINKQNGKPFTDTDVNILEAFSIFCGLGIHNCQMYESACMLMAKQTVALEVLSYHATASLEDTEELMKTVIEDPYKVRLFEYEFSDFELNDMETCAATVEMFVSCGIVKKFRVPMEPLSRWVLSVKKNYRPVTYHNWRHAFNVAQTMYTMCYTSKMNRIFVDLEIFALLVACLSHDLDHRGTNNTFQNKVDSPIAQLYSTSTMEHHHFDQCIMILNSEGNNIFKNLTSRQYREALKTIESAILSTDLALYFKKKGMFMEMVDSGEKNWIESERRDTLRGMMMTACDVAAITKPWEIQQEIAGLVSAEFFEQGDLERDILNEDPIAMMDRKKKELLPKMQCGFIDFICLPLYKVLAQVEIQLKPLLDGVQSNRDEWQKLADIGDAEAKARLEAEEAAKAAAKEECTEKNENEAQEKESENQNTTPTSNSDNKETKTSPPQEDPAPTSEPQPLSNNNNNHQQHETTTPTPDENPQNTPPQSKQAPTTRTQSPNLLEPPGNKQVVSAPSLSTSNGVKHKAPAKSVQSLSSSKNNEQIQTKDPPNTNTDGGNKAVKSKTIHAKTNICTIL